MCGEIISFNAELSPPIYGLSVAMQKIIREGSGKRQAAIDFALGRARYWDLLFQSLFTFVPVGTESPEGMVLESKQSSAIFVSPGFTRGFDSNTARPGLH
mgnify:CR=1 FL=1